MGICAPRIIKIIFKKKKRIFVKVRVVKFFPLIIFLSASIPLFGMQELEQAEIAALAAEFSKDYEQHVQEQESAFRVTCIQRLFLLNKKRAARTSPYYNFQQRLKNVEEQKNRLATQLLPGRAECIENEFLFYCKTHTCTFDPRIDYALQSWKKDQN